MGTVAVVFIGTLPNCSCVLQFTANSCNSCNIMELESQVEYGHLSRDHTNIVSLNLKINHIDDF